MYLLDANVFIQAKKFHYGFDICPGFWEWIERAYAEKKVYSIEKVQDELVAIEDELPIWAANQIPPEFFLPSNSPAVAAYLRELALWVDRPDAVPNGYTPVAISSFFRKADYFLVAHARALGFTVVTHETLGNDRGRVKIPNACNALGVLHLNAFQMLRAEGVQFIIKPPEPSPKISILGT